VTLTIFDLETGRLRKQNSLQFNRIGNLDILHTDIDASRNTLILLHGYGADFQDLAGLKDIIDPHSNLNWIFPNGPVEISLGFMGTGRAWFTLDLAILEQRFEPGSPHNFADNLPNGIDEASNEIIKLIETLDLNQEKLILGGFSQGAMVSCHTLARSSINPLGLLQLSSTLVCRDIWTKGLEKCKGLNIFQSHGRYDSTLPFPSAVQLNQLFNDLGMNVHFEEFNGGHEIPAAVCQNLQNFLAKLNLA
jgi:phospholipase/carboxylesterase